MSYENAKSKIIQTNLLLEKGPYQELRKRLVDRDMSFSEWVRIKIEEELATGRVLSSESDRPADNQIGEEETNAKKDG